MARRPARQPDLPPELAQLVSGLTLDQMRGLLPQLLAHGGEQMMLEAKRKAASRRQPRRDPATLVLRIDLAGAKPPVWRRVEVPSTLMLDQVHDLLQLLFGWYDGHLHRFALGSSVWDRDAESFLSGYDLEEGEQEGIPEAEVRLDEVLAEPGDVLRYVYDYGDEWLHALKLEKVLPERCVRLRVLAGKHEAPAEDSGGIWTWNDDPDLEPLDVELLDEDVAEWGAEHVLDQ
jgi:hypothetical protein